MLIWGMVSSASYEIPWNNMHRHRDNQQLTVKVKSNTLADIIYIYIFIYRYQPWDLKSTRNNEPFWWAQNWYNQEGYRFDQGIYRMKWGSDHGWWAIAVVARYLPGLPVLLFFFIAWSPWPRGDRPKHRDMTYQMATWQKWKIYVQ
jgi:hypothetical protein